MYAFCSPSVLNVMLEYRACVLWLAIGLLVLHVTVTSEAWYNIDQNLLYIFTFILFLSCFNVLCVIAEQFVDSLLDVSNKLAHYNVN